MMVRHQRLRGRGSGVGQGDARPRWRRHPRARVIPVLGGWCPRPYGRYGRCRVEAGPTASEFTGRWHNRGLDGPAGSTPQIAFPSCTGVCRASHKCAPGRERRELDAAGIAARRERLGVGDGRINRRGAERYREEIERTTIASAAHSRAHRSRPRRAARQSSAVRVRDSRRGGRIRSREPARPGKGRCSAVGREPRRRLRQRPHGPFPADGTPGLEAGDHLGRDDGRQRSGPSSC